ncbi:MAG: hypothetical protein A3F72_19120 [Bacteroidetes bacterium RIFCSPLOWO2_12_FULL_35_15]|nr:MAG: hypothetical protein A3F72_19120 [Bacteroidetes bacterium RIFCSPLOWO2_12_FULL_35_15]
MKKYSLLLIFLILSSFHLMKAQESDTACATITEVIENNSVLRVFPNPSDGTFQIYYGSLNSCPPAGWGGILIINIINSHYETVYYERVLVLEDEYNKTIDLSSFEKGIYIIEVAVGKRLRVRREVLN